jgi:hypothetical protein
MRKKIVLVLSITMHHFAGYSQADSTVTDSVMLYQVQTQLQETGSPLVSQAKGVSANPDISVIGDFRGLYRSNENRKFDAELHEAEISLQSVVDPYARADFFVSIGHDPVTGEFKAEIEEGYLTTLSLPAHLQLKAGKFKQALGRINPVHPHALPFIDMPNAYVRFFGEEGMNDEGASLSWLIPNNGFYQELTFEFTNGPTESPGFIRSSGSHYMKLIHLKNFWDLSSNATLEIGLTGISGPNHTEHSTNMAAFDLTYKWKPVQYNTYKSVTFQNEFYLSHANTDSSTIKSIGLYSLLTIQISKRWFATTRYDYTNQPFNAEFIEQAASASIGWYATEFQKIELQGKYTSANNEVPENNYSKQFYQAYLRWIFVIGTHGAHQY